MTVQDLLTFITILTAMGLLFWVASPLFRGGGQGGGMDELARDRERALLSALAELYRGRDAKKLEADDFANIERRLTLELARLYQSMGVKTGSQPEAAPAGSAFCTRCGAKRGDGHRYCVSCGAGFEAAEPVAG